MTNVNFDQKRFTKYIKRAIAFRENLKAQIQKVSDTPITRWEISNYEPDYSESLVEQGQKFNLELIGKSGSNVDIYSLKLTALYGIKGPLPMLSTPMN